MRMSFHAAKIRVSFYARFLAAAENLAGAYQFGVYDLLVLPPSFPYGGMVSSTLFHATTYSSLPGKPVFDLCDTQ